jgi:hypothetical protein
MLARYLFVLLVYHSDLSVCAVSISALCLACKHRISAWFVLPALGSSNAYYYYYYKRVLCFLVFFRLTLISSVIYFERTICVLHQVLLLSAGYCATLSGDKAQHFVLSLPLVLNLKVYAGEHQLALRKGSQLVLTLARAPPY